MMCISLAEEYYNDRKFAEMLSTMHGQCTRICISLLVGSSNAISEQHIYFTTLCGWPIDFYSEYERFCSSMRSNFSQLYIWQIVAADETHSFYHTCSSWTLYRAVFYLFFHVPHCYDFLIRKKTERVKVYYLPANMNSLGCSFCLCRAESMKCPSIYMPRLYNQLFHFLILVALKDTISLLYFCVSFYYVSS